MKKALMTKAERDAEDYAALKATNEKLTADNAALLESIHRALDYANDGKEPDWSDLERVLQPHPGASLLKRLADAEARAKKEREESQHFVDASCYYRNLAVTLGMKPEQARNPHDRSIVEDYAKDGGFVFAEGDWTVADEIREQEEHWAKVDRAEAAESLIKELVGALESVRVSMGAVRARLHHLSDHKAWEWVNEALAGIDAALQKAGGR